MLSLFPRVEGRVAQPGVPVMQAAMGGRRSGRLRCRHQRSSIISAASEFKGLGWDKLAGQCCWGGTTRGAAEGGCACGLSQGGGRRVSLSPPLSSPGGLPETRRAQGASFRQQQPAPAAGLSHTLGTRGLGMAGSTSFLQAKAGDGFFALFAIMSSSHRLEMPTAASHCQEVGFAWYVAVGSSGLVPPGDG